MDDCQVVVSELVGNAVRYGGVEVVVVELLVRHGLGMVQAELRHAYRGGEVAVSGVAVDERAALLGDGDAPVDLAESGRGLLVVEALTKNFVQEAHGPSLVSVWSHGCGCGGR
ncbi:hypothetical protein LO762_10710 [Actinocorallia sp. API 0066]|uniref:hypothetical protein n=1 Tax=Actinocorallia sp. API 0066 TaxID=2896846 RepID=UPI001E2E3ADB|nr:hypothetical protein [Actinocorallia sp. API 0066]MCD0449656.1 hypothetical protein [Actinocorallia sp. API 0066]